MRDCPYCGYQYEDGSASYCAACGLRIADAIKTTDASERLKFWGGETRMLSVFFVNFVGLESLLDMGVEQDLMLILRKCMTDIEDIIRQFNGTSNRIVPDNRILGIFGAPKAHQDDPVRSLHCAWEIRNWWVKQKKEVDLLKDVVVTIGINTGRAFFGYILEESAFLTVIGDTINTAARLTEMCPPNELLMSEDTFSRVEEYVDAEHIGERSVKGKAAKVNIFLVKDTKEPVQVSNVQKIPFCGRKRELEQLIKISEGIKQSKAALCIITGQMGIGKSRLKEEYEKYLSESSSFQYLETHCSVDIASPYFPFKFLLTRYFEISEYDDNAEITRKIHESIAQKHMSPLIGKGLLHLFLTDMDRLKQDEMLSINEEIYTAVKNLFIFECHLNPMVIIFEEFNKADEMTKYLISYLTSELRDEPIMFLLVNVSREFLSNIDNPIEEINLTPLAFQEIRDLITHLLENVDDKLVQFMYKSAGGNPLFTIEAIRNTRRTKVIRQVAGKWTVEKDQRLSFLDDLYGVIMSTIDSLPSRYRLIIDYASVVGYSFSYRILQGLLEYEGLSEQLNYLVDEGYIIMSKDGQDPIYVFRHNLLKDAAYTVLPMRKRREIHKLVAVLFEELYGDQLSTFYENIAHHYLSCENYGKAASYFVLAGDKAKNLYAIEQALKFYNLVLEIDKDTKNSLAMDMIRSVLLSLADLYEITGDIKKMEKISIQGLTNARSSEDKKSELDFMERYGYSLFLINKLNEAEELLLTAVDNSGDGMADILSVLYSDLGILYQSRNEYEKSILHYNLSWKTAQTNNITKGEILCLFNMAKLHNSLGNYEQSLEYLEYGLNDLIPKDDIRWQLHFKYETTQIMFGVWSLASLHEVLEECFEMADSIDSIETYIKSALDLAIFYSIKGDSQKVDDYLKLADAKVSFFIRDELLAEINYRKARVSLYQEDYKKAADFTMSALTSAQKLRRRDIESQCYQLQSLFHSKKSLEHARTALEIAEEIKLPPLIAAALFRITELYLLENDAEQARHYGRKALFIHDDIKFKLKTPRQQTYISRPEYVRLLEL
jgi:class 3 adenylate cyclase/tetratricopeptide (TPR) repeat protein